MQLGRLWFGSELPFGPARSCVRGLGAGFVMALDLAWLLTQLQHLHSGETDVTWLFDLFNLTERGSLV